MHLLALADRPDRKSYAIVPFIVRSDDGCNHVCGHRQRIVSDQELAALYKNPIGARDISPLDVHVSACDHRWVAGWVGKKFAMECVRLGAPPANVPEGAHILSEKGSFWIGDRAEIHAWRHQWTVATARQIVRMNNGMRLADLLRWADPSAPEAEAAIWHTCTTKSAQRYHLQWCAQAVPSLQTRPRTDTELEEQFRSTIETLRQDSSPV